MEVREAKKLDSLIKLEKLGYWNEDEHQANKIIESVNAIELGRIVARDIGGLDIGLK